MGAAYLTAQEYISHHSSEPDKGIPASELEERLCAACRDIDTLTFDRIKKVGFEGLTEFQQELVRDAVRLHADFCYDNAELLESPLASYAINGVSMSFDRSKIVTVCGVTTSSGVYNLLMQTGLCYRGLMS